MTGRNRLAGATSSKGSRRSQRSIRATLPPSSMMRPRAGPGGSGSPSVWPCRSTIAPASRPNGRLQRFTRNPGPSAASMTRRPIAWPVARAVASGAIIVAAAGNDATDQPHWPGRYAADPRFANSMIVAGASTRQGGFAPWSNKAGATQDRYVAAAGEEVVVDCTTRWCQLTSGTSYSVAYVAGAVALLLSRDARLSGPQAAQAVLRSARDLGAPGADPVSGRGLLDIRGALQTAERSLRSGRS